jgi:multicomponent Na+:H+ antiporter subunit D
MTLAHEMAFILISPFAAALLVGLTVKRTPWMRWAPFVLISGVFLLCLHVHQETVSGVPISVSWFVLESVASFFVKADPLATYFSLIISGVGALALLYAAASLPIGVSPASFYVAMLSSLGACMGVAFAGDLFTLYIFFEVLAVASYLLVIQDGSKLALRAGYRYLVLSLMAGLSVLGASLLVHAQAGTVAFDQGPLIIEASRGSVLAFYLFLGGFGLKAGMFPLHIWLPNAHASAPAPASAILSGILLKCGAVGIIRAMFYVYTPAAASAGGGATVLMILAVASIIVGSLGAMVRFELKRLLAYSSIGQMGYILLGIALRHPLALTAALFHMSAHALMKSCLFLCAGTFIETSKKKDTRDLNGLSVSLPLTSAAFSLAALSMIGIPPFNGFVSKYFLGLGALNAKMGWGLVVLLVSSFLNVLYYSPILTRLYWQKQDAGLTIRREGIGITGFVVSILALACLLFGLSPLNAPFQAAKLVCISLMGGY